MDLYQSLYDFIAEARNYSMVFWLLLPVYSGSLKRIDYPKKICLAHPLSFECFLLLLKELIFIFLFVVTAAGIVTCGSSKKRPRTSAIVQFIFYFWSFEISRNILLYSEKSENIIGLDSYILNIFSHLEPIWIYISHCITSLLKLEITVWFSGFYCQFIQGLLIVPVPVHCFSLTFTEEDRLSETDLSGPTSFLSVFTALKGTHFYIFICCHSSWHCAVWQP